MGIAMNKEREKYCRFLQLVGTFQIMPKKAIYFIGMNYYTTKLYIDECIEKSLVHEKEWKRDIVENNRQGTSITKK